MVAADQVNSTQVESIQLMSACQFKENNNKIIYMPPLKCVVYGLQYVSCVCGADVMNVL